MAVRAATVMVFARVPVGGRIAAVATWIHGSELSPTESLVVTKLLRALNPLLESVSRRG